MRSSSSLNFINEGLFCHSDERSEEGVVPKKRNFIFCHSEASEESSYYAGYGFFIALRSIQNDTFETAPSEASE